ncbi:MULTISPECIES: DUF1820 family protein [Vibrio]|uniref:DUF1820 family protein n=2 Tax=Vibrio TaxID=662 RepID=A0A7X4RX35_9VIBR|nr:MULTISPECIES: DUF1820 family protein [Vibrio]MBF9003520.1 DUF1820 family protein [Vibrio nitrifigilis]MZI96085.1 DUF1820 family protein [Vibrio eleionomae]
MSQKNQLYKVSFIQAGQRYEVYVREVVTSNLFGFVELADFVWDNHSSIVVDPSHERLKAEFAGVERTYVPLHSILRIDQVAEQGSAKIVDLGDKVAQFPSPIYTPSR